MPARATRRKPPAKPAAKPNPAATAASKADATRALLLERALALFQQRGVEATTMRDIAKAAKLSLGAAYYHFQSKDALVFAYYEDNQAALEAVVDTLPATATLRERLGAVFHAKLASIAPHRAMLATIVHRLLDPRDEVSAFSDTSRAIRARAIAQLVRALEPAKLAPEVARLAAAALWLLLLATMLVFVRDPTPDQRRTHALVDEALDMLAPLAPLLASPFGRGLANRIALTLARADIFTP